MFFPLPRGLTVVDMALRGDEVYVLPLRFPSLDNTAPKGDGTYIPFLLSLRLDCMASTERR